MLSYISYISQNGREMLCRVGDTTWFPSAGNETPMKSLSSRYTCTVPTLLASIMENLLFGAAREAFECPHRCHLPKERNDRLDRSFHAANAP
jgi:hypothetical protein